jgi:pimeloyl-ACP methyl ester carboxylesterase
MAIVREPYGFIHKDQSRRKDTYGGPTGRVFVECMRIRQVDSDSDSVIVFSHPIGGGAFLPMVTSLAHAGRDVIYVNPRYRGNDTALIMEKCIADLGAAIRDLKTRFGYTKVIMGGWSGGGSLSLFYQDQAERPTITHTPDGTPFDLVSLNLIPADAVLLLAAHVSRAVTLTEWMDPSILDEEQPFERDPELDLYNPLNPHQPPFTKDYIARYRQAQIDRNRRITARAKRWLAEIAASDEPDAERCFTVQGTMADLRWRDASIDPSDRTPNTCYLGDPRIVNDGPVGLARFTTARSWLSQWSYDETNAGRISCPVLVVNNTADLACTPSHAQRLFDAVASADKSYVDIKGADHYYADTPELMPLAVETVCRWLKERDL